MIPRNEKAFFDVPMGAVACNCGGRVVAQGRCQECYDKFVEDFARESAKMSEQVKDDKKWYEDLFRRKMSLIRI